MRARAVIGANYGDEGKGLVTDYLCAKDGAGVVVRFNGGAQAGHTVVTPGGDRHVFHHFGSGSFIGVPTFLSRFFVCNPLLFTKEYEEFENFRVPRIFADPECLVTTFADMLHNQETETARGADRHGSCGVGFAATIQRDRIASLRMRDLWKGQAHVEGLVVAVCKYYKRAVTLEMMDDFLEHCDQLAEVTTPATLARFKDPVFEGAQGLLLDQGRTWDMPYLTRSNTGMRNVRILCDEAGIDRILPYYVSRSYVTRHGAGPLDGERFDVAYSDNTNVSHPFQGVLRFADLKDYTPLRCAEDARGDYRFVMTHCDQLRPPFPADLYSFGPTRESISTTQGD